MLHDLHQTRRPYLNSGPQLTPRMEHALRFIGTQGAIRFDHLQRLFGHHSPAAQLLKEPGVLSEERTRKILRRWFDEEIYLYRVFFVQQKGWIWLTRKGLRFAGVDLRYYEPAPSSLAHLHVVNEIRLETELLRPSYIWRSERELRAEQDTSQPAKPLAHLPDAELVRSDEYAIAVECELTVKSEKRLQKILHDLAYSRRYSSIWYFAPEPVYKVLAKAIEKIPREWRGNFGFYDLTGKPYTPPPG